MFAFVAFSFLARVLLSHKSYDSAVIIVSVSHNAPPVCALVLFSFSSCRISTEILEDLQPSLFI